MIGSNFFSRFLLVIIGWMFISTSSVYAQSQMNFAPPLNAPFGYTSGFVAQNSNFVDIDGDGDKDYFRNTPLNGIRFVENIGNAAHPVFIEKGGNAFGIVCESSVCDTPPLFFADIDNDGDQDAIGGYLYYSKRFIYYENIGSATNPAFVIKFFTFFDKELELRMRYNNTYDVVEYDFNVGATLVDIDGDGDLDLFAGGFFESAPLYFARNTGTPTNPKFTPEGINPFGLNNVASEKFPVFLDFDNDNDLDAVIGYGFMAGPGNGLTFFRNNGSKTSPNFINIGANLYGLNMPVKSDYGQTIFTDIDNDGDLDAFLPGDPSKFYRNTTVNTNAGLLPQTITGFGAIPTLTAGKQVYSISGVTGGASGNPVRFVSADPSIVQVVGNNLLPLKAGSTKVYAVQLGNDTYQAGFVEQIVTVIDPIKIDQTISGFDAIPNIAATGSTYTITGVTGGSSGNPIVFTSNNPSVARIEGNQIIAVANGYAVITATQAGNNDYAAAKPVVQGVQVGDVVTSLDQEIVGFPSSGLIPDLYPGQSFTITGVTGGASGNPVVFSISDNDKFYVSLVGNTITALRPKSGNIRVGANQAGNSTYYDATPISTRFKVINDPAKTNQTINGFTIPNSLESETTINLSGVTGGTSGNPIVFIAEDNDTNKVSIRGNAVTFKEPGMYTITAIQAGSSTHNPATPISRTVRVKLRGSKQYQQILNFFIPNSQVVGNTYTITGITGGASGNPITYYSSDPSVVSVSGNVLTMLKKGQAEITAMQNGNASFYPAVRQSITVYVSNTARLPQNITGFGAIPDQIVGNTYTVTGATGGASGNPIEFRALGMNINGNKLTFNKVGTFEVLAFQPGNEQYLSTPYQTQIVRVKKIPQIIQNLPSINPIFVGGEISLDAVTGGASGNSLLITSNNPTVATITGKIIKGIALGTAQITIWQFGDDIYENAIPVVLTVSVQATLTKLTQSIVGFGAIPNLNVGNTFTLTGVTGGESGNPVIFTSSNPAIATVSGNVITAIAVGNVTITASQEGNTGYEPAINISQNLTVNSVVSVENPLLNETQISLYPNPAKEAVFINFLATNLPDKISLDLFNSIGQLISQYSVTPIFNQQLILDVTNFPEGLYVLKFKMGRFNHAKKIYIIR